MIEATFQFPGHQAEERAIDAMPKPGDPIEGPAEAGMVWKVSAVFWNAASGVAEITCKPEAAPAIVGDAPACLLTS